MACCFEELEDYTVTPMIVSPCVPEQCCDRPSPCYVSLPRCPKREIIFCERTPNKNSKKGNPVHDNCCNEFLKQQHSPELPRRQSSSSSQEYCPTCNNSCKPIKTKYVIPCYRYEDGRIEQYVPTRHGRLPASAYRRNGIQDQIYGYRGATRYLCAGDGSKGYYVYTAVEPIKRLYPKITQEMLPVNPLPSSAFKRNGIQDQNFLECGAISYIRKSWKSATWSDVSFALPIKPMKKLPVIVSKKR
ncbi:unnamed protein product [Euphydryas editha]|uniref:Uncharacterized protein n=1 Tax=Euphydryas editha TaxID=104508 RepID=A0AAU9UT63_EUPED|nr:unnamed protein product [Euphydryas editha]